MTSILAEIDDKMPTLTEMAVLSAVLPWLPVGAGRLWSWAFWGLALPLLAVCNLGLVSDLRDSSFADALWNEMGPGYVYGQFAAVNGAFVLAGAAHVFLNRRNRATNSSRGRR